MTENICSSTANVIFCERAAAAVGAADIDEGNLMGDQSWAQAQSEEAFSTGVDDMFGVPPTRREQAPCTVADIVYAHELYITVLVS